jgi:iron-sulfur cluster assembly accessory protein
MSLQKKGITVTINAWKKLSDIIKQSENKYGFLYSSSSGGCSGFNFDLGLLDKNTYENISKQKYLTVLTGTNDEKVFVDPVSEMYLLGTTIDYITEDYSQGQFENKFIFEVDKDLLSTCGCGISFTPKH